MNSVKMNDYFKNIISIFFGIFLFFGLCSESIAQNTKSRDLHSFKIIIERNDNEVKMKSLEGSSWVDLQFTLSEDASQAINESGMTDVEKESKKDESKLSKYLFTVKPIDKGLSLTGVRGVAWKELSFSNEKNQKWILNQFGVSAE